MTHISIFLEIIALITGSAALLYVYQHFRKYRLDFIRSYLVFTIITNIVIINMLFLRYFSENLYTSGFIEDAILIIPIHIFFIYSLLGLIYYRFKVTFLIRNKLLPAWVKKAQISLLVLVSIILIKEILFPYYKGSVPYLYDNGTEYGTRVLLSYIILIEYLSMFIFFIELTVNAGFKNDPGKRKSIILFGLLHIFVILLLIDTFWQPLSVTINDSIHSFLHNLIPLIWFRFIFVKYYLGGKTINDNKAALNLVVGKYNITRRESEIIALILQGKSNKEIMDLLHLSLNTVRNHIYNVYQKLKVNSRTQLINVIMEYSEKEPD
ncbi:response regulator transcription factor [candidate division KSB1 bacterium]